LAVTQDRLSNSSGASPPKRKRVVYLLVGIPILLVGVLMLSHGIIYGGGGIALCGGVFISCAIRGTPF
jgi:hypothetical protein